MGGMLLGLGLVGATLGAPPRQKKAAESCLRSAVRRGQRPAHLIPPHDRRSRPAPRRPRRRLRPRRRNQGGGAVDGERLFALNGFRNVSVRDITAEAGVNLRSVNHHFGSKDALLFEIFRRRTAELEGERARMQKKATAARRPPTAARDHTALISAAPALVGPRSASRRIAMQFIIPRAAAREPRRFAARCCAPTSSSGAIRRRPDRGPARPGRPKTSAGGCHFTLGMIHNNRFAEFDRLHVLSEGLTRESDGEALTQAGWWISPRPASWSANPADLRAAGLNRSIGTEVSAVGRLEDVEHGLDRHAPCAPPRRAIDDLGDCSGAFFRGHDGDDEQQPARLLPSDRDPGGRW